MTRLRNGAEVIRQIMTDTDGGVVLANTNGLSAHTYVTWRTNDRGDTFWGHYFMSLDEAHEDFEERAAKLRR